MITIKSKIINDHLDDLEETFDMLEYGINPSKCSFGTKDPKFLGFYVDQHGIQPNSNKIQVIIEMSPPNIIREIQCLDKRINALSRFISKIADKCRPFFQLLKIASKGKVTIECNTIFENLKNHLVSLPLLTSPKLGEELFPM